jgi:hypothetical protein
MKSLLFLVIACSLVFVPRFLSAQTSSTAEARDGVIVAVWTMEIQSAGGTGKMQPPNREDGITPHPAAAQLRRFAVRCGTDTMELQLREDESYDPALVPLSKGDKVTFTREGNDVNVHIKGKTYKTMFISMNPLILPRK